ncbi:hypothetical protein DMUE_4794, partial [Dictyocoela muelleri]
MNFIPDFTLKSSTGQIHNNKSIIKFDNATITTSLFNKISVYDLNFNLINYSFEKYPITSLYNEHVYSLSNGILAIYDKKFKLHKIIFIEKLHHSENIIENYQNYDKHKIKLNKEKDNNDTNINNNN